MHYLDSTFLASCSFSLVWHAIASAEAWHAVLIKIYSIILRILLGHKSPSTAVSVKHQRKSEKRERERCKCITCKHTQPLLSLFFPTHDHTFPLSVCFSLSTLIVHVSWVAGALKNPIICRDMWSRPDVWQWVSLDKGLYHFTTLTLTWLLFEELWRMLCGSGERGGKSGWWVRWLEAVLTGFPGA